MKCMEDHTDYQPTDAEWECPVCDSDNEYFWIEESATDNDCELLHSRDVIICAKCGYGTTGKKFANKIKKEKNLMTCPHCNGKGVVDESAKH